MPGGLIGRENSFRRAQTILTERGVVVVAGGPGVGVTALSRAVADDRAGPGGDVVELRGTNGLSSVRFGALAVVLPTGVRSTDAETIAAAVEALSTKVVFVDDAHLLDEATAGIVSALAQDPNAHLILAVSVGESLPHDLTSIWARWPDCRIDLEPLDRDEVGMVLRSLLGSEASREMVDEVHAVSLGYPLYVAAVAEEMRVGNGSTLDSLGFSDRLTRLLERRLARLRREERRVLDAIAFGESVPASVAASVVDSKTLASLEASGLVENRHSHMQLTHPLLAGVARETLTIDGRRESARLILSGLDNSTDPADIRNLVTLALSVGVVADPEMLHTAASRTLEERDYEAAAEIAGANADEPSLAAIRAQALRFLGEVPEEPPSEMDDSSRADWVSARSQALAFGERRFAEGIRVLKRGIASTSDPTQRNRLATELMVLSGLSGDIDALLGAGRAVTDDAGPETRLLAVSTAHLAEGLTLSTAYSDDTYATGRRLVERVGEGTLDAERMEMAHGLVQLAEGDLKAGKRVLSKSDGLVAEGSRRTIEAVLADSWSSAEDALAVAERAVASLEGFDPLGNLPLARQIADLRRAQVKLDPASLPESDRALEPAVAEIDRTMHRRADAWYAWAAGDTTAGKRLIELGRDAVATGHRLWGLLAFLDAVRLGLGSVVAGDAEQLAISRGAGLAKVVARHARADSAEDFRQVARVWWEAGAPTYAVEALIRAGSGEIDVAKVQVMGARGAVPLVDDGRSTQEALSERQVEIVLGVIYGAPNEEVAEALYISKRTVENHLHRLYRGLGITNGREGLIEQFGWIHEIE